jgi:tRNA-dihydrouridine synthase B
MKIGNIEIKQGILLAPMEDVTNMPFRLICKRLGADIVYTEFISSEGLIRDAIKSRRKLVLAEEERPVGIQIFGGNMDVMVEAAQIAEESNPDLIDINCGCWVKNVVARNAGAALLRDLPQMEKIASAVVNAVKLPVTLKTRLGWDTSSIRIVEVAQMLEATGIQALAVHCRTRAQGHDGAADWTWIPRIKEKVSIPIITNGDIKTPQEVKFVFDTTGCDAVMIGRGAIYNPWIFLHSKHYLQTGELLPEPSIEERIALCIEHLTMEVEFKGETRAVIEFRKHYSGYLRGVPNIAKLRAELMPFVTLPDVVEKLQQFALSYREVAEGSHYLQLVSEEASLE